MRRQRLLAVVAGMILFGVTSLTHASLSVIGTASYRGESVSLIYDNDSLLTWLDYSNPRDAWQVQLNWAASLNNPGVLQYHFYPGVTVDWTGEVWRLSGVDEAQLVLGRHSCSDLGHLFFDELNVGAESGSPAVYVTEAELNAKEFDNLREYWYWTRYDVTGMFETALAFDMRYGDLSTRRYYGTAYGLAVHSGQVIAVPVPGAISLLGSGLAGLLLLRKRRNEGRA